MKKKVIGNELPEKRQREVQSNETLSKKPKTKKSPPKEPEFLQLNAVEFVANQKKILKDECDREEIERKFGTFSIWKWRRIYWEVQKAFFDEAYSEIMSAILQGNISEFCAIEGNWHSLQDGLGMISDKGRIRRSFDYYKRV